MDTSSAEEPVVAQGNGEEISAPSASPISDLTRLSIVNKNLTKQFKWAQGRIVALEGEVNTLRIKLCRAAGLIADQQKHLDPEYTFPFGQEEEEGSVRGNDEEVNPIDLKELKSFLAQETKLRLDAEDKTRELKSVTEEYKLFINEIKEHLMEKDEQQNSPSTSEVPQQSSSSFIQENQEVPSIKEVLKRLANKLQERLSRKEKEIMELKKEVSEKTENSEKLVEQINFLQFKQSTAPQEKISAETQTNEVPKGVPVLPVAVPPQEQEQKDGNVAVLEQIPDKSKRVEPEVITLDDSPPVSPQPIPIDSEGTSAEYISAVPNSSSDIQKFGCDYCLERFPFNSNLEKHLEEIHNIEICANGVAQSIRRVQSQRRSVKRAKAIKPRKNVVKRRNSTKKRISASKASGPGPVNQMNKKFYPHRQVSRTSSENYACACKRSYARKSELQAHIEEMKKKVAD